MSEIGDRRRQIDKCRRKKLEELMGEYDKTVYYPAMKQLVEDCEKIGHSGGKYHDNGLGWHWFYCGKCGGRYDVKKHTDFTSDGADV